MTKTEQAWQRVKDAHDEMMRLYAEYLDIAQEEGVLPKVGHVYHQKNGWANKGKDIVVNGFPKQFYMPDSSPSLLYSIIKKDGTKGENEFLRSSFNHNEQLIYKGEYTNDQN